MSDSALISKLEHAERRLRRHDVAMLGVLALIAAANLYIAVGISWQLISGALAVWAGVCAGLHLERALARRYAMRELERAGDVIELALDLVDEDEEAA